VARLDRVLQQFGIGQMAELLTLDYAQAITEPFTDTSDNDLSVMAIQQ
jgi:hypothetical protein